MKWLVVVREHADREAVLEQLRSLQCEVLPSGGPIPFGAGEVTYSVDGPAQLAERLTKRQRDTFSVYPSSKKEAFRG